MRNGSGRLPTLLLAALILLPAIGFLPRLLGEPTPLPLDRRPTWAHTVVVTCEAIGPGARSDPGLVELERRAARAAVRLPEEAAEAVAQLWTGRAERTGAAAWTLAGAVRDSGGRTAAFSNRPYVTGGGLAGFDRVLEDPGLSPADLAELLAEQLESDRRTLTWLHLETGADDGALGDLLEGVHRALEAAGHRWDALVGVTALGAERGMAPLWAELPSALYADRAGTGAAPLVDVAGLALQLLRLPGPDLPRGQLPIESTGALATLLQGGALGD